MCVKHSVNTVQHARYCFLNALHLGRTMLYVYEHTRTNTHVHLVLPFTSIILKHPWTLLLLFFNSNAIDGNAIEFSSFELFRRCRDKPDLLFAISTF